VTPGARSVSNTTDPELAVDARLSSVNAVFTLSLILTQASSPGQVMRLPDFGHDMALIISSGR